MKFLLDTNILIPAEPTAPAHVEASSPVVTELLGMLERGRHQIYVHPDSVAELLEHDRDVARRETRRLLLQKYITLPAPPPVSGRLRTIVGDARPGSHDAVDHALLAAAEGNAVHYFVTNDAPLLRKAKRAGLDDRVVSAGDALAIVRGLFPIAPPPPPAVDRVFAHELDEADPIFDSFRQDYHPDFDEWLRRCKLAHRTAFAIRVGAPLAGVSILKEEDDHPYDLEGRILKVCSFKIADTARGYRFGELLLKSVFSYAFANKYDHTYLTVLEKYFDLVALLEAFGFRPLPSRTRRGELVMAKPLKFNAEDYDQLNPLDFNIRFGPPYFKVHDVPMFAIPIRPQYHGLLFPDAEQQLNLIVGRNPYGNAIRKAYLCHANTRQISPGSVLLFYRSRDHQAVHCIGVAEGTLVDRDPEKVARFVGQRTVYSYDAIGEMCREGPVLAILFRHARTLGTPFDLASLVGNRALAVAPQSIVRVREEGREWLRDRLVQWP